MSINEISKETGISWVTVRKYIKSSLNNELVIAKKENIREKYEFNYPKIIDKSSNV